MKEIIDEWMGDRTDGIGMNIDRIDYILDRLEYEPLETRLGALRYTRKCYETLMEEWEEDREEFLGDGPLGFAEELRYFHTWLKSWKEDFPRGSDPETIRDYIDETLFVMFRAHGVAIPDENHYLWSRGQNLDGELSYYAQGKLYDLRQQREFLVLERIHSLTRRRSIDLNMMAQAINDSDLDLVGDSDVEAIRWMVDSFRWHGIFQSVTQPDPIEVAELRAFWQARLPTPPQHVDELPGVHENLRVIEEEINAILRDQDTPSGRKLALAHAFLEIARQWVYTRDEQPLWQETLHELLPILRAYHQVLLDSLRELAILRKIYTDF